MSQTPGRPESSGAVPSPALAAALEGGLGTPPPQPIAVLPPIEQLDIGPKLSDKTGQPVRPPVLLVALGFFYLAALVSAVTLAFTWWKAIHMETFPQAARVIELLDPRPEADLYAGSWQSILAAVLMMAIGVILVAAPWLTAFNAWEGQRWARVFGLVSVVIAGLMWFMTSGRPRFVPIDQWLTWVPWIALPACLAGAVLLWLAPVGRFFADFGTVRHPPVPAPPPSAGVSYGSLERYR